MHIAKAVGAALLVGATAWFIELFDGPKVSTSLLMAIIVSQYLDAERVRE